VYVSSAPELTLSIALLIISFGTSCLFAFSTSLLSEGLPSNSTPPFLAA
jgi:hypothetical protein